MEGVEIKDRITEVEYLRMALNLCELPINYEHADLIVKVVAKLEKTQGDFTLQDGVNMHHKWKNKWQEYYKNKEKENNN